MTPILASKVGPAARDEHQGLHRGLPLRCGMLGFRRFGDGVLEG
jgi:hypothetical protein